MHTYIYTRSHLHKSLERIGIRHKARHKNKIGRQSIVTQTVSHSRFWCR